MKLSELKFTELLLLRDYIDNKVYASMEELRAANSKENSKKVNIEIQKRISKIDDL